jgi:hypothetical protein
MAVYNTEVRMIDMTMKSLLILLVLAATATSCDSAPGLELLGRELFEGPPREAVFFSGGMIIASGGAVMVIPAGKPLENGIMLPLGGLPSDIEIIGARAWIAVTGSGLAGIDLGDPSAPHSWTACRIEDAHSCASAGDFLIVSGVRSGLYLFDTSGIATGEPLSPLYRLADMAPGAELVSAGDLIAAASGSEVILLKVNGVGKALDEISRIKAPGKIDRAVMSADRVLHLLSREGEVFRYDVRDPASPVQLSPLPEKKIRDICLGSEGGMALLGSGMIMPFPVQRSYERSGEAIPADPRYSLMNDEGMPRSPAFPGSSIRCGGDRIVTFGPKTGFHFYRNDRGYTRAQGKIEADGFAFELAVSGDHIYLANGMDGLRIGRTGEDGSVKWAGHARTGEARDVAIEDGILVLADGAGGARFYNIDLPESPALLSTWQTSSYLSSVKVRSGVAYFAGGLHGVAAVDFTDPAAPSLAWSEKLSEVRGLDVDDDYLYVADGFSGFRIYSLAGDVPVLVSTMDTPGWVSDLSVSGDLLYIADGQRGFMIADISDRSAPAQLGRIETGGIARTIHARGDTVFLATQSLGVTVVDASNPRRPVMAARYGTVDDARGVFSDERFVYLASGSGGLYIFRYK